MADLNVSDRRYELLWRLLRKHILRRSFVKSGEGSILAQKKRLDDTRPGKV